MATLETFTVKPSDLPKMTIKALDGSHLGLILNEMFTKGIWKDLSDNMTVKITQPWGETISPEVRNFRN